MDTREVTEHLLKAGFEEDEALHMIQALEAAMQDVATKDDIDRLGERVDGRIDSLNGRIDSLQEQIKTGQRWTLGLFSVFAVVLTLLQIFA